MTATTPLTGVTLTQDVTVQFADEKLARAVLPMDDAGEPVLVVVVRGNRAVGGEAVSLPIVASPEHLGYLVGMIQARVKGIPPNWRARYEAARELGRKAAAELPTHATSEGMP